MMSFLKPKSKKSPPKEDGTFLNSFITYEDQFSGMQCRRPLFPVQPLDDRSRSAAIKKAKKEAAEFDKITFRVLIREKDVRLGTDTRGAIVDLQKRIWATNALLFGDFNIRFGLYVNMNRKVEMIDPLKGYDGAVSFLASLLSWAERSERNQYGRAYQQAHYEELLLAREVAIQGLDIAIDCSRATPPSNGLGQFSLKTRSYTKKYEKADALRAQTRKRMEEYDPSEDSGPTDGSDPDQLLMTQVPVALPSHHREMPAPKPARAGPSDLLKRQHKPVPASSPAQASRPNHFGFGRQRPQQQPQRQRPQQQQQQQQPPIQVKPKSTMYDFF